MGENVGSVLDIISIMKESVLLAALLPATLMEKDVSPVRLEKFGMEPSVLPNLLIQLTLLIQSTQLTPTDLSSPAPEELTGISNN